AGEGWTWHLIQRIHGGRRRDRVSARLQARPRRHRLEAEGLSISFRPLARLAQNEERRYTGGEAGRGGRMGQKETAVTGKNRIVIYGPKNDCTYIVEFKTAEGEALAISVPGGRRQC